MVTKLRLAACVAGIWQARNAFPFSSTAHAPHTPMPQPNFVPVRPKMILQDPEQRSVVIDIDGVSDTVNSDANFAHRRSLNPTKINLPPSFFQRASPP